MLNEKILINFYTQLRFCFILPEINYDKKLCVINSKYYKNR